MSEYAIVKLNNVYSIIHIRHSQVNKYTTKYVNGCKQEKQDIVPQTIISIKW